jgi:hypothetical protein
VQLAGALIEEHMTFVSLLDVGPSLKLPAPLECAPAADA